MTGGPSANAHIREMLIEAALLATFMLSAVAFTALLEHPASLVRGVIESPTIRRGLAGIAMGLTAAALIYSPWGRRSGAHLNPVVTLTFLRLGKIAPAMAARYAAAHFTGAAVGLGVAAAIFRHVVADPSVNYVATLPGQAGSAAAAAAETVISFGMMTAVLVVSNTPRLARYTGVIAASLVAIYILLEAPLSGMSMNPARSLAPALAAGRLETVWIYFIAPAAGMLLAAETYVRRFGLAAVRCAKMHHPSNGPCHFRCDYGVRFQSPGPNFQGERVEATG